MWTPAPSPSSWPPPFPLLFWFWIPRVFADPKSLVSRAPFTFSVGRPRCFFSGPQKICEREGCRVVFFFFTAGLLLDKTFLAATPPYLFLWTSSHFFVPTGYTPPFSFFFMPQRRAVARHFCRTDRFDPSPCPVFPAPAGLLVALRFSLIYLSAPFVR